MAEQGDKRILMHMCCGPCSEWPLESLRSEGYAVTGFFYNPNIHPLQELAKRIAAAEKMADIHDLSLVVNAEYGEDKWRALAGKTKAEHCRFCYALRLKQACDFAAAQGFSCVTSSLMVSPYQDQELIRSLGRQFAQSAKINFLEAPFQERYRYGQDLAVSDELYRQKYCGCIYSLAETAERFRTKLLAEFSLQETDLPARQP